MIGDLRIHVFALFVSLSPHFLLAQDFTFPPSHKTAAERINRLGGWVESHRFPPARAGTCTVHIWNRWQGTPNDWNQLESLTGLTTLIAPGRSPDKNLCSILARCASLRTLRLEGMQVTDAHVPDLVLLDQLTVLDVNGTAVTDAAVGRVARSANMRAAALRK